MLNKYINEKVGESFERILRVREEAKRITDFMSKVFDSEALCKDVPWLSWEIYTRDFAWENHIAKITINVSRMDGCIEATEEQAVARYEFLLTKIRRDLYHNNQLGLATRPDWTLDVSWHSHRFQTVVNYKGDAFKVIISVPSENFPREACITNETIVNAPVKIVSTFCPETGKTTEMRVAVDPEVEL